MSFLVANALKKERDLYFKGRVIRKLKQTKERVDLPRDEARKAMLPGKRVSKSGKVYWETRQSRSDRIGESI